MTKLEKVFLLFVVAINIIKMRDKLIKVFLIIRLFLYATIHDDYAWLI